MHTPFRPIHPASFSTVATSTSTSTSSPGPRHHSIPLEILDDLASRFIINAPDAEKSDLIRMCFQIELAHWFYLDEYVNIERPSSRAGKQQLRTCTMREFAEHMFRHIGFLKGYADNIDYVLEDWKFYKQAVPTYGAIILNEDLSKVLLAQGYWSKTSWGFPKGKVNEDEAPHLCAVREVYEETGFDIADLIDPDIYLQTVINDQTVWLYLIPGVPSETKFQPRTKYEIRDLRWFDVGDLPANKKEQQTKQMHQQFAEGEFNMYNKNLYMVMPFVKSLRKWISGYKQNPSKANKQIVKQTERIQNPAPIRKVSESSKSEGRTQNMTQVHKVTEDAKPEGVSCPKIWSNFHFKKKDILTAMTSTPGWQLV